MKIGKEIEIERALFGRYLAHAAFAQVGRDGLKNRGRQCEVEDAIRALEEGT